MKQIEKIYLYIIITTIIIITWLTSLLTVYIIMDNKLRSKNEYISKLQQRVMIAERKKQLQLNIINQKVNNISEILSRVYPGYDYKQKIENALLNENEINKIPENLLNIYVEKYLIASHGMMNYKKVLPNLQWPIKNGFIAESNCEYGTYRPYFNYGYKHEGIDINNYYSDEVIAPYDCNIWKKYYDEGGGWSIEMKFEYIDNENYKNWYFVRLRHLNKIFVTTGQPIKKGSLVGSIGNTGIYSTGKHLHFELWEWDGLKYININPVLNSTWKNKYIGSL